MLKSLYNRRVRYAKILAGALFTLWGAATVVFFLLRAIPGDPAAALAGERADPALIERIRRRWDLDRPLPTQYLAYLKNLASFDLGESIASSRPVTMEIAERLAATAELAGTALAIAILAGIPLGILAGTRRGTLLDAAAGAVSITGVSVPIFVTGYALILIKVLGGIPFLAFAGRRSEMSEAVFTTPFFFLESFLTLDAARLGETAAHLALPALTLAAVPLAAVAKLTRSGVAEILDQPYILAARARGIPPARLLFLHVFRNVAVGVWTALGLQAGYLLGGAVLTETVFAWPGLGTLFYQAVTARDYPVVQGMVLLSCGVFLMIHVTVDALHPRIDPRLRPL